MTIFSSEFLGWNLLSSRFCIGIYYGILGTLPIAPSQLLSIRVLLLEDENKQGKMAGAGAAKGIFIAGVSGFLVAQLAMFLSIYCVPLYTFWFKPHVLNLLFLPLLLWHYFRIIEFDPVAHLIPNYKYPILDPRVRTTFLESFLFQFLNPIVLPNPVFTRLMSLFLFKYSHVPIFICGSLLGWLSGQILFILCSWLLLTRLQLDSPAIYRIVKRVVHAAFPPIMIGICLSYIGRVAVMPFPIKIPKHIKASAFSLWPDSFYLKNHIPRPMHFMLSPHQSKLRNQPNAPFNLSNLPLHKSHFSQYYFESCIIDGKKKLIHNYPINLSLIHSDLKTMTQSYQDNDFLEQEWINKKELRLFRFYKLINSKILNLDKGVEEVIEKRLHSLNEQNFKFYRLSKYLKNKIAYPNQLSQSIRKYIKSNNILSNRVRKSYDPRLGIFLPNQSTRSTNESAWLINQDKDNQISPITKRNYLPRWNIENKRLIRLKKIISKLNIYDSYFELYKKIPVWRTGYKSSDFFYEFEFFKENLTRRRRRRFFVRSSIPGTLYTKSRNSTGIFRILEAEPRSVFFLRAKEINIDLQDNIHSKQRLSQTESEKFDFANSHSVRGPSLITQAFIRKYIKLPVLILGKNIVRLVLFQSSEWNQDWFEWTQEKYIYCFYNGDYTPNNQLPPHWLGEGLQIKILSPFHLKPWRPLSINNELSLDDNFNNIRLRSSYINIWGQETDVPFGEVQYHSFFKPIFKGLVLFVRYQLAKILRTFNRLWLYIEKQFHLIQFSIQKMSYWLSKDKKKDPLNLSTLETQSISKRNINYQFGKFSEKVDLEQENILPIETEQKINKTLSNTNINNKWNKQNITDNHFLSRNDKNITENNVTNLKRIAPDSIEKLLKYDLKSHKLSILPSHVILKNPYKYLEYQKIKITILMLQFYQKIIFLQKRVYHLITLCIRETGKKQLHIQRTFVKLTKKVLIFYKEQNYEFTIKLVDFIQMNHLFKIKTNLNKLNRIDDSISSTNNYSLSHAYILHKIWHMNVPNRLSLRGLFTAWHPEYALQDHIQIMLNEQGLINQEEPQNINLSIFKEWLRPFRRYIPSPEIWNHISVLSWRKMVNEFWIKNNILFNELQYQNQNDVKSIYPKYLFYYKPLFAKAKKMNKRWEFHLLINSYTDSIKNQNIDNLCRGWHDKNREQTLLFRFQVMNQNLMLKKHVCDSQAITWGLSNTKTHGLAPSFSFKTSFQKTLLSNKKITAISSQQPIYFKYKNRFMLEENEGLNLKERVSFSPILQYRWKSEEQRLKALDSIDAIKKAKSDLQDAMRKSMLANKNKMKSASIFDEKLKEASFRWKTISLSKFTCQVIKTRQARILDDEIIMHSMIASFLRFKNRYLNHKNLELLDPTLKNLRFRNQSLLDPVFFLPEEILLPKSVREYRTLTCLNSESQQHKRFQDIYNSYVPNSININLDKEKQSYSNQIIKRYIWPTYRIEDLACMNRFWISIANQSRFSSLRIKMYPNLAE